MQKVIMSNKLYLKPDEKLLKYLERHLTFQLPQTMANVPPKYVTQICHVAKDVYSISRGSRHLLDNYGLSYELVDKRVDLPANIPDMLLPLRPDQENILRQTEGFTDYIINGRVGFGKTVTACGIIAREKQKTLIVVPTTSLREQWKVEIKKFLGVSAGQFGSGVLDTTSNIVVTNIQTAIKHVTTLASAFGMIIVDECHRAPASTFLSMLEASRAKYRVGLSATTWRKDGLHCLLPGLFSPMCISPEKANTLDPEIIQIPFEDFQLVSNEQIPWAVSENMLYDDPKYIELCKFLVDAAISLGYKTLLTANRKEFIHKIASEVRSNVHCITSDEDIEEREASLNLVRSGELDGIIGTLSILKEGVSCNDLSCLILTSSTNNKAVVAQVVGRIMRLADNKKMPIVIDITLPESNLGSKHLKERLKIYKAEGWKVHKVHNVEQLISLLQSKV